MRVCIQIILVTTLLAFFATGCTKRAELASPRPSDVARIRVINASPNATMDVYLDKLKTVESLDYQKGNGYVGTLAGDHELSFYAPETTEKPYARMNLDLKAGHDYTVVAYGSTSGLKLVQMEDDNTQPSGDKVKIRFLSLIDDVQGLDFRAASLDKTLAKDLKAGKPLKYMELDSGVYEFSVNLLGLGTKVASLQNAELKPRGVYTIIAMGNVTAGNADMVLYEDKV